MGKLVRPAVLRYLRTAAGRRPPWRERQPGQAARTLAFWLSNS